MKKITVLIDNKKKVVLDDNDYLAQGGEGTVYVKGDRAFKIYHNSAKMIPLQKIRELQVIDHQQVIAPKEILYDKTSGEAVGFTMHYVPDTEYLCRLFVGNFKKAHNIFPCDLRQIVTGMRQMLLDLHAKKIVVADYNEMNILVDAAYTRPYMIDVDSYQTPGFRATAIMDSVRDRLMPYGEFNCLSDWFSWAVVTFQLFTGIHPFKGKHPDYKSGDLDGRMRDGVSVFHKDVRVPPGCRDVTAVPAALLDWYKKVFVKHERSVPPKLDATTVGVMPTVSVRTTAGGAKEIFLLARVNGGDQPVKAVREGNMVYFRDAAGTQISCISATAMMAFNGNIYTLNNQYLVENRFLKLGKVKHTARPVANVPGMAVKLFNGVVVMDLFGSKRLLMPYAEGRCTQVKVPELDGYRVVDAVVNDRYCLVTAEQTGRLDLLTLYFDRRFEAYQIRIDQNVDPGASPLP